MRAALTRLTEDTALRAQRGQALFVGDAATLIADLLQRQPPNPLGNSLLAVEGFRPRATPIVR